jgi:hypothetical protein
MPSTRRRNGPVSRLLSPVEEGVGLVTRTGSHVLKTGDDMWRSLGNGVRDVVSNVTHSVDHAGSRLVTGQRGGKGSMRNRNRSNRNRSRKNRNRSNRSRKNRNRNRSNRNRK